MNLLPRQINEVIGHDWIVTWHDDGLSETLKFFL